jgi:hypothetical protein
MATDHKITQQSAMSLTLAISQVNTESREEIPLDWTLLSTQSMHLDISLKEKFVPLPANHLI